MEFTEFFYEEGMNMLSINIALLILKKKSTRCTHGHGCIHQFIFGVSN